MWQKELPSFCGNTYGILQWRVDTMTIKRMLCPKLLENENVQKQKYFGNGKKKVNKDIVMAMNEL